MRLTARKGNSPTPNRLGVDEGVTELQPKPTLSPTGFHLRAREITNIDLDELAKFLGAGLGYPSSYYLQILHRLREHPTPPGFPKFGFVLENDGRIVGAILLIFSKIWLDDCTPSIRSHVTSWYVEPKFRCFATLFFSKALKFKDVTYINISARQATLPIIKAQGFSKYSSGQFVAIPLLNSCFSSSIGRQVKVVDSSEEAKARFEPHELDVLREHAGYGCISLWCRTPERAFPFIFHRRLFKGLLPGVQLVFCRDIGDFVRFAAPLGRFLAARGILAVSIDSNGPIPGLIGKYFEGVEPRYYKGVKPRLGDLAYTQAVMSSYFRRNSHT